MLPNLEKGPCESEMLFVLVSRRIVHSSLSSRMRYPGSFLGKPVNVEDLESRLRKIFRGDGDANMESE